MGTILRGRDRDSLSHDELNGMRRNVIRGGEGGGGASGYGRKDILKSRFVGGAIVAAAHKQSSQG